MSSRSDGSSSPPRRKHRPKRSVSFPEGLHPGDSDNETTPLLDGSQQKQSKLADVLRTRKRQLLPLHASPNNKNSTIKTFAGGILCLVALLLVITVAAFVQPNDSIGPPGKRPSPHTARLIHAAHGAVASESETCSKIGVEMLKQGGSAVDAAIAATLCIGVVNMFSSGIGGGGFMIIKPPNATAYTIDFRETAPTGSNSTMFLKDPFSSVWGGLSSGVPGEVRGLAEAHGRWGVLPWETLFEPSIKLALGFRVSNILEDRLVIGGQFMVDDPDWSPIFAPYGQLVREGEIISRLNYSRTLAMIAEEGAGAFYHGPIAQSIVEKVQATGGIMTLEDLASYKVHVKPALEGSYRGRKIYTTDAPTSGPVVLHILNLLDHYDLVGEGRTALNIHRLVEALKFGFAARTRICDPAFHPNAKEIEEISTREFAELIFKNITDDKTHTAEYYHPVYDTPEDHGTTHTSVLDQHGMAVSITSTVNLVFGSRVLDPNTGIIMNDEMDDFAKPGQPNWFGLFPSPYNYPAANKRPLSSTAPTILTHPDGSPYLILGGAGGSRIFGSIVQAILNIDWGMDISRAIEHGRVHDQLFPWMVDVESTVGRWELDGLRTRGHNVTVSDISQSYAAVEGVMRTKDGVITAASDSRKQGVAAGY